MSETKRKLFSGEFKAKVALEAIRGIKTVNQIAQDFGVHPTQVSLWKKELQGQASNKIDVKFSLYLLARNIFYGYTQRKIMDEWFSGRSVIPPHIVKQEMLKKYCKLHGLKVLVETGTYFGDMVESMKHQVDKIYSVELSRKLFEKASARFSDDEHIEIINGDGGEVLPQIMQELDQPTLFWLDGHYSAGFTVKAEADTSIYRELTSIFEAPNLGHVVIIDDARCFGNDAGYPTIDEIKKYVFSQRPDTEIVIENDSIIIHPR